MANTNNLSQGHLDRITGALFQGAPELEQVRKVAKAFSQSWRVRCTVDGVTVETYERSNNPADPVQIACLDMEQWLLRDDDDGRALPDRMVIEIVRNPK
jgi:hypothetical protein